MRLATIALAAAITTAAVGCSPQNEMESSPGAEAAADTTTGTVRRIGNEPFVRTLVQGEDTVFVSGALEPELATLAGAQVMIVGQPTTGDMPGETLEVTEYTIVSVDGDVPAVGRLESDDEGYFLSQVNGEVLRLTALSPELAAYEGAKVWLVVSDSGTVQRYGIIAAP